jgi:uncharacterized protein
LGAVALGYGLERVPFFTRAATVEAPWAAPPKKVLMFTKSSGYEHSVIARSGGRLSFAEQVVTALGSSHGFEVNASKDGRVFSSPELDGYDAFFFYTTGDLTTLGHDGNPPMSPQGKERLLELVRDGKGFIGTHSAADTFDTAGKRFDPKPQLQLDPYLKMLGAEFLMHDHQQKARLAVADEQFPGMAALDNGVEIVEEWYAFRDFQPDLHVLAILETQGMVGPHYERPPFPNTWVRLEGRGRVFYTALGHRQEVWSSAMYQSLLVGGISWALRDVNADVKPNVAQVTPRANTVPRSAFGSSMGE